MLVSFDTKFVRQDQKMARLAESLRPTCFWSSLINLISKDPYVVSIYHALLADLMAKRQRNK